MTIKVHTTAIVDQESKLADGVVIGPYTIVGRHVKLGEGTQVGSHCVLDHVTLGCDNIISPGVYMGQPPQHSQQFEQTHPIIIGDGNQFREGFTVHRGIDGPTQIGSGGLFMAYSHVAHDCQVADGVVMANNALLGGYTEVGERAFLSGNIAVHQFCRVGRLSFLGGVSAATMDIMPFCMAVGRPAQLAGLNSVGLERANFSRNTIRAIKKAYRLLFRSKLTLYEALNTLEADDPSAVEQEMIAFARSSTRGLCRHRRKVQK